MYAFYKNFAYCLPNCFFAVLSGEVTIFMMCVDVTSSSCSTRNCKLLTASVLLHPACFCCLKPRDRSRTMSPSLAGFSAQPLYTSAIIATFNVLWTAWPTIAFAALEQASSCIISDGRWSCLQYALNLRSTTKAATEPAAGLAEMWQPPIRQQPLLQNHAWLCSSFRHCALTATVLCPCAGRVCQDCHGTPPALPGNDESRSQKILCPPEQVSLHCCSLARCGRWMLICQPAPLRLQHAAETCYPPSLHDQGQGCFEGSL